MKTDQFLKKWYLDKSILTFTIFKTLIFGKTQAENNAKVISSSLTRSNCILTAIDWFRIAKSTQFTSLKGNSGCTIGQGVILRDKYIL